MILRRFYSQLVSGRVGVFGFKFYVYDVTVNGREEYGELSGMGQCFEVVKQVRGKLDRKIKGF